MFPGHSFDVLSPRLPAECNSDRAVVVGKYKVPLAGVWRPVCVSVPNKTAFIVPQNLITDYRDDHGIDNDFAGTAHLRAVLSRTPPTPRLSLERYSGTYTGAISLHIIKLIAQLLSGSLLFVVCDVGWVKKGAGKPA